MSDEFVSLINLKWIMGRYPNRKSAMIASAPMNHCLTIKPG